MAAGLAAQDFTSEALVQAHLDRIAEIDQGEGKLNAFLHVNTEGALATAREVDAIRAAGGAEAEALHPLAGVPIAIKDLVVTTDMPTTGASKFLDGWISPYDATVTLQIREAKMPILGKTNLDEFAMGSSTEHSGYGLTRNNWDANRIPGGSGGGSAVAVGSYQAPLALGTDTGGSIRQPAAFTGTVGTKPTYGAISRYGVISMASSLDQVGPVARTVEDAALLQDLLSGHDPKDATSLPEPIDGLSAAARSGKDLTGVKIGIIKELRGDGYQAEVLERFKETIQTLTDAGATCHEVSLPNLEHALAAYYLIMSSEVSSNMARFDGVRYGKRVTPTEGPLTIERVMGASRAAGFGDEVKRRVLLGTYALSSGYYDAFYGKAQKVRTLIQRDFSAAFEDVDVLISPSMPSVAFEIGAKVDDPTAMYRADVTVIPVNLAGIPAISVPSGLVNGLPVGVQLMAPIKEDARLYQIGAALESILTDQWGGPLLAQQPGETAANA
ncbi:Asp-tRNA(Asn)/Glu-tRNA(Gln) amidotransferase subunit GatA [Micrococcoides hystricis]|uniref:Glutamyl-tRNA(Gln) amidotransferase subunit A n=1 Tax=Micrococcoides hystricis TaxID=1572761 RepID=A0ABV6PAD5_9MICC